MKPGISFEVEVSLAIWAASLSVVGFTFQWFDGFNLMFAEP